jgi:hypothetical protein
LISWNELTDTQKALVKAVQARANEEKRHKEALERLARDELEAMQAEMEEGKKGFRRLLPFVNYGLKLAGEDSISEQGVEKMWYRRKERFSDRPELHMKKSENGHYVARIGDQDYWLDRQTEDSWSVTNADSGEIAFVKSYYEGRDWLQEKLEKSNAPSSS